MVREIAGIEKYVRVTAQDRGQEVTFGDRQFIEEQYCYTEPAFFDLFNFPILKGRSGQLVRPNTMVITEVLHVVILPVVILSPPAKC